MGGVIGSITAIGTAEVWDASSGAFLPAGSLLEARSNHTATALPDGRVIVIGGGSFTQDGFETHASAEAWDPATGSFEPAGTLAEARLNHTSTLLADGRVLVVGGVAFDATAGGLGTHQTAELWDPVTMSFETAGALEAPLEDHSATLLPDGCVLVVGGREWTGDGYAVRSGAQLWDPRTGSFAPAGSLVEGRTGHTATLLPGGRVLIVGGTAAGPLASAEVWTP